MVNTVLKGLKKSAKRESNGFDELSMYYIFTKCLKVDLNNELLDKLLLILAVAFRKKMRQGKGEAKVIVWSNWYFSVCLHYVRYWRRTEKRDWEQDCSSSAVHVLYGIINNLLFTEGISALSVISAFAGKSKILPYPASRS